jgi:hypothetical protein
MLDRLLCYRVVIYNESLVLYKGSSQRLHVSSALFRNTCIAGAESVCRFSQDTGWQRKHA